MRLSLALLLALKVFQSLASSQPDRTPQPSSISSDPETSQTPVSTGGSETSAAVVPAPNSTMSSGAGPSGLTAGAISSRLLSSNTGEDDQKVSEDQSVYEAVRMYVDDARNPEYRNGRKEVREKCIEKIKLLVSHGAKAAYGLPLAIGNPKHVECDLVRLLAENSDRDQLTKHWAYNEGLLGFSIEFCERAHSISILDYARFIAKYTERQYNHAMSREECKIRRSIRRRHEFLHSPHPRRGVTRSAWLSPEDLIVEEKRKAAMNARNICNIIERSIIEAATFHSIMEVHAPELPDIDVSGWI